VDRFENSSTEQLRGDSDVDSAAGGGVVHRSNWRKQEILRLVFPDRKSDHDWMEWRFNRKEFYLEIAHSVVVWESPHVPKTCIPGRRPYPHVVNRNPRYESCIGTNGGLGCWTKEVPMGFG